MVSAALSRFQRRFVTPQEHENPLCDSLALSHLRQNFVPLSLSLSLSLVFVFCLSLSL